MGETGIGASELFGHLRVAGGEASDVQFIDQRLVPGSAKGYILSPAESLVDNDTLRYTIGAIPLVF
jgi:hypothetical protein